jgi:hypothetical protein
MIRLACAQRGAEWRDARLGIPTASHFSEIITPRTMKPSASADKYRNALLAEWVLGIAMEEPSSHWMDRGIEMEEAAVRFYQLQHDTDTEEVGFILRDDEMVGCSPDRFVGEDGILEIKVPSATTHIGYLLGTPADDYKAQVQGQLWITERQWVDVLSYHPSLPPALVRVERDEEFICALESAVNGFVDRLLQAREFMIEKGYVKRERQAGAA